MKAYWQETRAGLRLLLEAGEPPAELGGIRRTPRGYDAFARADSYDPDRARKGFQSLEEARAFVEGFRPWDIFVGGAPVEVEPTVRPTPEPNA